MESPNTWNEYSRLVLKELETLAHGISNLSSEIQDVKREIAIIKDREDKVAKLQEWKDKVVEIVSISQLETMKTDVADFKEFKTKAITIFLVIQTLMALAMGILNYLK